MESSCVRARNSAPDSENRIHDDRTAALYGFRAGLVPGVAIYGYLTRPVIEHFGEDWLARGGMRVRFLQPVYDGDELIVALTGNEVTVTRDATVCAAGEIFWPEPAPPDLALYPEQPLPAERPAASAESLFPGRTLGTLYATLAAPDEEALLTLANHVLMQNVKLGPWLHVASEVRHFSIVRSGDRLSVRGRVADQFERKGNRFVVLDIAVVAGGDRLVQQVRHTAIYELRPRAAA